MSVPPAADHALTLEVRDQIRAAWLSEARRYSPFLHLALPALFGVTVIGIAASLIQRLQWTEALFGAGLLVFANGAEWRIHKRVLHTRARLTAALYERHTPRHHMVFVTDDMALRSPQEFRLVLLPGYAIVLLVASLSPISASLWLTGHRNLAAVFVIVTTGYVLIYEWSHLSFHLPRDSKIGSLALVRWMARHHSVHHDPRVMQRWNMNVVVPFWDLIRGTRVRSADEALQRASNRSPAPGNSLANATRASERE
jgi:hypothetical protein